MLLGVHGTRGRCHSKIRGQDSHGMHNLNRVLQLHGRGQGTIHMQALSNLTWRQAFGLLMAVSFAVPSQIAAAPPCADLVSQGGENGYQARGSYCEGLFVEDIRSSVRLRAIVEDFDVSDVAGMPTLHVSVPGQAPSDEYRLEIHSLDPRVNYQLDTLIPANGLFSWSVEIIESAGIDPSVLRPLAWADTDPVFYVPVSFPHATVPSAGTDLEVLAIFESTVPIVQYVAWLSPESGGQRIEPTSTSRLPATQLVLVMPSLPVNGYYKLWLRVLLVGERDPELLSYKLWLP